MYLSNLEVKLPPADLEVTPKTPSNSPTGMKKVQCAAVRTQSALIRAPPQFTCTLPKVTL